MTPMETKDILKALPHRYPIMLVDRVTACDLENKTIQGIKNVSFGESFLQGHFPDNPIMPGVLQIEALAQLGGIMLNKLLNREGKISYFSGIDKVRFRRIIVPGDQMLMTVTIQKLRAPLAKVHGTVHVGDALACEGDLTFAMADDA